MTLALSRPDTHWRYAAVPSASLCLLLHIVHVCDNARPLTHRSKGSAIQQGTITGTFALVLSSQAQLKGEQFEGILRAVAHEFFELCSGAILCSLTGSFIPAQSTGICRGREVHRVKSRCRAYHLCLCCDSLHPLLAVIRLPSAAYNHADLCEDSDGEDNHP